MENIEVSSNRTKISIENRWTTIQRAVNKFCGFYAAIERMNESGKNEQDRVHHFIHDSNLYTFLLCWFLLQWMFVWLGQINDAIRMYEEIEPWQFHHCWVILRGEYHECQVLLLLVVHQYNQNSEQQLCLQRSSYYIYTWDCCSSLTIDNLYYQQKQQKSFSRNSIGVNQQAQQKSFSRACISS